MVPIEKSEHVKNILALSRNLGSFQRHFSKKYVLRSWERCLNDYGLDPSASYRPKILTPIGLRDHREPIEDFLRIAKPWMERLYQQVSRQGKAVLITNEQGVTLDCIIDPGFSNESEIPAPCLGSVLTENHEGTNGIGICLQEKRPLAVEQADHFRTSHIRHTCIVSPIYSPRAEFLAVLNVSSVKPSQNEKDHFQTLQLVYAYARLIENDNFLREFQHEWVLCLSLGAESTGVITESLLAINGDGRIIAIDQSGRQILSQKDPAGLINKHISDVFEIRLDELMRRADPQPKLKWPIRATESGAQFFATLRAPEAKKSRSMEGMSRSSVASVEEKQPDSCLTLVALAGQDPQMIYNVGCIRRVMNKDISIILNGETGTGKEAFAQAIHHASNRKTNTFVAVNCASIPESLIESELFGYKPGAFTGARSRGMRGKILQSNGGTLFLDEIGDMPASLQTRLLRVLAEKEVTPLGSETPEAVDLHVICATHRNLKELVARGTFREDLYYRLNGVTLKLPALRERSDKASLVKFAFAVEAGDNLDKVQIGKETFKILMNYAWPGNIRQLRNALRFALAISEGGTITPQDLPPETIQATEYSLPYESDLDYENDSDLEGLSAMERTERDAVLKSLEGNKWNVTSSANDLGLARATMYRKMKKYNLIPPNER